jgi:hypothetical protein
MNNLTQTQIDAKQAYLNNQQEQMIELYEKANTEERNAIIRHINSFLSTCNEDEKRFWLKFRYKLEILNEKSFLFPLGSIFITNGAREILKDSNQEAFDFLMQHQHGEWGDLGQEDIDENIRSLKIGYRLLSAYKTTIGDKLWVITEPDRSFTTILLPSEY